jgi:hypothetical protein
MWKEPTGRRWRGPGLDRTRDRHPRRAQFVSACRASPVTGRSRIVAHSSSIPADLRHDVRSVIAADTTGYYCLTMSHKRSPRRQAAPPKACLFCGSVGPLNGEHIYGDWLRNLGYTGEGVREIIPGDGSQPIIQRSGPFNKKLKIVCYPCNNQWMSGMETAAQSLLTAMFNARGSSVMLDATAQVALARWAFKTAAVAAQIDHSDPFPLAHCREFRHTDRPPCHAQIRIGTASIPTLQRGEQLAEFRFEPRTATITQVKQSISFPFYRASFRLLNVVFDILGYVAETDMVDIDPDENLKRTLLPLWPSEHPRIWWPPVISLDVIGGLPGLAAGPIVGIPTLVSGNQG